MTRPPDFECPWCGPNGVPVNWDLPPKLRLCDLCNVAEDIHRAALTDGKPQAVNHEAVEQLRAILLTHVVEFRTVRWQGAEFGKTIIGNAILGALQHYGCDPKAELQAALAAARPDTDWSTRGRKTP